MRIRPFDPRNDDDVASWHAVAADAQAHDFPTWPELTVDEVRARVRAPDPAGETVMRWLADAEHGPIGIAALTLLAPPNEGAAEVDLAIRPEHRRSGHGRALLRTAAEMAAGRARLHISLPEGAGGFAERVGLQVAQRMPESVARLGAADAGWLAEQAGASSPGYRLERWIGQAPDEHVASFAVARRAMADAPTGETGWQTPAWDPARIREDEAIYAARGDELRIVAALTDADEVAGLTEVVVSRYSPRRAHQEDTLVVPAHRGHGLGLRMKADMVRWLRAERPEVVEIATWNAEENRHMRGINETLGYAVETWWLNLIGETAALAAH